MRDELAQAKQYAQRTESKLHRIEKDLHELKNACSAVGLERLSQKLDHLEGRMSSLQLNQSDIQRLLTEVQWEL